VIPKTLNTPINSINFKAQSETQIPLELSNNIEKYHLYAYDNEIKNSVNNVNLVAPFAGSAGDIVKLEASSQGLSLSFIPKNEEPIVKGLGLNGASKRVVPTLNKMLTERGLPCIPVAEKTIPLRTIGQSFRALI